MKTTQHRSISRLFAGWWNRKGFTLIEILVTVLIVGILAAVAVPQYQRALLKSRYAGLMPIAKSMADSNEAYYLEHGIYADDPQDLLVQGQTRYTDNTELEFGTDTDYSYVLATNTSGTPNNVYVQYQKHSKNFPGNIHCEAADDDELATWLCRDALHGTPVNTGEIKSLSGEGYTAYVLSGSTSGSTFDRTCEGDAPTEEGETCPSGCGKMTATASCNPYTGEWNEPEFDDNSCPSPLPDDTQQCENGTGMKIRHSQCKADGSGYEYGAWDESACCTGAYPSGLLHYMGGSITGSATGSDPVCVNGQWEWTSFSSNIVCQPNPRNNSDCRCQPETNVNGASNGGPCTGEYKGIQNRYAQCDATRVYACVGSTFSTDGTTRSASYCYGNAVYGCANSTFIGKGTSGGVFCSASQPYSCANSTFKSGAYCNAQKENGCANTHYEEGGYCEGQYCPEGSPANSQHTQCWDGSGGKRACA